MDGFFLMFFAKPTKRGGNPLVEQILANKTWVSTNKYEVHWIGIIIGPYDFWDDDWYDHWENGMKTVEFLLLSQGKISGLLFWP